MTTETIVEAVKINKVDRVIANTYTVGTYRVTVQTRYFSGSKAYVSTVRESKLQFGDGYVTEISQFNIGLSEQRPQDDYNQKIQTAIKVRYNFKDLENYHALAVNEANDSLIITELLLKGKTNSEIFEGSN